MPPDPLILAFDTSVAHCAAALLLGDKVLAERVEPMAKGQAERLFVLIEELLCEAGVGWKDLTCIGVGTGPGNFTGIRISVSAARGLALSLGVPAIGISNLEAQAEGTTGIVVSVLDARQEHYYIQVLGAPDVSQPVRCELDNLPPIPTRAEPSVIGFDAKKISAQCSGHVCDPVFSTAVAIAKIAMRRLHNIPTRPAPLYLRAPDAAPPRDTAPVILP
ncbi:MAG: tRNA (adenosine(37)-N6)-threonylcarbamoyltransferase complex dimerization subunit type 1 TsaB [Paracoccaceae bacterium]